MDNMNIPDWEYYFTMLNDIVDREKLRAICVMVDPDDRLLISMNGPLADLLGLLSTLIAQISLANDIPVKLVLKMIEEASENSKERMREEYEKQKDR